MTNSLAGRRWQSKHKERIKWQRLIEPYCRKLGIINLNLNSAVLTLTRHSSKAPDADGLVSGFKGIVDSLVACKVIIDDNYKIIGMPNYKWEYRPHKLGGMMSVKIEAP